MPPPPPVIASISVFANDPQNTGGYQLAIFPPDQGAMIPNVGDIVGGENYNLQVTGRIFRFTPTSLTVQLLTKQSS